MQSAASMHADSPAIRRTSSQLRNLQLLRAVAALSVVTQHAIHDARSLSAGAVGGASERYALNFGYGVDIFFVISGFIMAHTMAAEFGTPGAWKRFLLRRLARIVPLYWLLTTILILGGFALPGLLNVPIGDAWHVAASYLFVPDARVSGDVRPVLALGWTLNYEMFFYVLFAVALLLPIRRGVLWLSVLMGALALANGWVPATQTQAAFWTNPIILEFVFGIWIALLFRTGLRIGPAAAAALGLLGVIGFLQVPGSDEGTEYPLRFLFTGVPAAMLILAAALGPRVADARALGWAVVLGDASYSLYLVHPFVVRPMRAIWGRLIGSHLPEAVYVVVCCAAAALVATILHRLVERPLTASAQRLTRERESGEARRRDPFVASRLPP